MSIFQTFIRAIGRRGKSERGLASHLAEGEHLTPEEREAIKAATEAAMSRTFYSSLKVPN